MKIILLGATGMLGHDIKEKLGGNELRCFGKQELDITDTANLKKSILGFMPNLVINCAAYTDVDGCEENKRLAMEINGFAVGRMARICAKQRIAILQVSTDYVFSGRAGGFKEDSVRNPINTYGASKLIGEKLISKYNPRHYIVRTAWTYGRHGKNFVNSILGRSRGSEKLYIVNDQFGSPTYTKDASEKIEEIIEEGRFGTYHVTNSGTCSRYDEAKEILRLAKSKAKAYPIPSTQSKRPAKRPKRAILLNTKLKPLRNWKIALKEFLLEK